MSARFRCLFTFLLLGSLITWIAYAEYRLQQTEVETLAQVQIPPQKTQPPQREPIPKPPPSPSPEPEPNPVAELLATLTTSQKAAQLLVAGIEGYEPGEDALSAIQEYQTGGIILFSRNVKNVNQLVQLTNRLKELNGSYLPLFLCVDEEGGSVSRMPDELENLPNAYAYGQSADVESCETQCFLLGQTLAAQCSAFGFNLDFAPVMDVWSNPNNTVIGKRAFSSDPSMAEVCANAAARGLQSGGIIPVGKHFPGHGDTDVDSHTGLPVVNTPLDELRNGPFLPFLRAIQEHIPALMVGHIQLTALDGERPASLSPSVVTEFLRGELGFEGVVCTDDLTMGAISNRYSLGEAAVLAVEAGCDLLLVCHLHSNLVQAHAALMEAIESGRITQERLDESVYRILKLKLDYGLTNLPVPEEVDVAALNEQATAAKP